MASDTYSLQYPRRVVLRFFMRLIGRLLMRLLARVTITGQEHLPKSGPLILVGNHVAFVEVIMMALYVPYPVEIIGTGDVPVDPRFAWIVNLWGFIPVRRGSTDRKEMQLPIDVLKQGGVVGIFPEGGIWESKLKKARTGVAWLSYHTEAPIVPIGFGGMKGALQAMFRFQRPQVVMNIGPALPAVDVKAAGVSRKEALANGADAVMGAVSALIPESEKEGWTEVLDERFDFRLSLYRTSADGTIIDQHEQTPKDAVGVGRFFYRPVILDVMARNMRLPVRPLQNLSTEHEPARLADALDVVVRFFDENPHFLSYRFGYEQSAEMYNGVVELREMTRAAAAAGYKVTFKPLRTYRRPGSGDEVTQDSPELMYEM